ncbi:hypothetical protein [Massilia sp. 9096]|uniref:hypothetical protein n=1 Tax=Massilia sp. 9096 TaxID=1500894 RepID=UPI00055AB946|nr:hypothetical protein [Massilia sp. 9096]
MDNGVDGHVSNVHDDSDVDTAVNRFLIERGVPGIRVCVDRKSKRPVPIPDRTRALLARLQAA